MENGEKYTISLHQYIASAIYDYRILLMMDYNVDVEKLVDGEWVSVKGKNEKEG